MGKGAWRLKLVNSNNRVGTVHRVHQVRWVLTVHQGFWGPIYTGIHVQNRTAILLLKTGYIVSFLRQAC